MTDLNPKGSVLITRYLDKQNEVIFATGQFDALFAAYDDHAKTWGHDQSGLSQVMMHQALGGCALYLSCRPMDEISAFTVNIAKPPTNIFVTGSASEKQVTGRPWVKDVKDSGMNRLYVQTQRRKGVDSTSVIDVQGIDILLILEDYCRRSDQAPARFFEIDDSRYLMAASLPRDDQDWLEDMDLEKAQVAIKSLPILDEREFWFQCGCDPKKLAHALSQMYAGKIDEFFQDDESLNAECPRCGRSWQIRRDYFEDDNHE